MKRFTLTFILLGLILLGGCFPKPAPTKESTIQPSQTFTQHSINLILTVSPSSTPLPTLNDTSTPLPLTAIPIIVTSTGSPEELSSQCLQIMDNLPPGAVYHGVAVLKGWIPDYSILINLVTGELATLPRDSFDVVSPDKMYLAYSDWSDEDGNFKLVVTDASGQQLIVIPWENDWFLLVQWLDNQRLVIIKKSYPLYSTVILNPFTGEQQEIPSDYPNIQTTFEVHNWGDYSYSEAIYDPTLTRVVYMQEVGGYGAFVLRDLQEGVTLGRFQIDKWDYGLNPKWSPDGDRLAIIIDEITVPNQTAQEFYTISREGQATRLTFFSNQYIYSRIGKYSWSPDGRYIAFWWSNDPDYYKGEQLAVLDTMTRSVINYCIPGAEYGPYALDPVWSPDGLQVLVENITSRNGIRYALLVDFAQGFAARIAEGRTPVGWMVSP
jgi:WD40-like Beta Propeller Repeat